MLMRDSYKYTALDSITTKGRMKIFTDCHFVLELDFTVSFKEKTALKKKITDNGGVISFLITAQTKFLLMNNAEKVQDSYKAKTAAKKSIPIVGVGYLDACIEAETLLDPDKYLLAGNLAVKSFDAGKIIASAIDKQLTAKRLSKPKQAFINVSQLPVFQWSPGEKKEKEPKFNEETYDIGKYALLQKVDNKTKVASYACVEVHVSTEEVEERTDVFRVFTHTGILTGGTGEGVKEVRYLESAGEAEYVYGHLVKQFTGNGYTHEQFISLRIGSDKLKQQLIEACVQASGSLKAEWNKSGMGESGVKDFVEGIWKEALTPLGQGDGGLLSVPVRSVGLDQVTRAEAILRLIRDRLQGKGTPGENSDLNGLSKEFYTLIPFKMNARDAITDLKQVRYKLTIYYT